MDYFLDNNYTQKNRRYIPISVHSKDFSIVHGHTFSLKSSCSPIIEVQITELQKPIGYQIEIS